MLGGIQFSAWFPFSDAKQFKIRMSDIIQHVPVAETIKETYGQFALKMDKPVESVQPKSDQEILEEYDLQQVYKPIAFVSGTRSHATSRTDDGWKDHLKEIKKKAGRGNTINI